MKSETEHENVQNEPHDGRGLWRLYQGQCARRAIPSHRPRTVKPVAFHDQRERGEAHDAPYKLPANLQHHDSSKKIQPCCASP
jgi:hypothetical protein